MLALLCCILWRTAAGQTIFERGKYDHRWLFGSFSLTIPTASNASMNFNSNPVHVTQGYYGARFDATNASVCNAERQLQFYTNGIGIASRTHQPMQNGERINPGEYTDDWVEIGNPIIQGAMIIPSPERDGEYHLFYSERTAISNHPDGYTSFVLDLKYAVIDMGMNNRLGRVLEKEISLIQDTLDFGKITATRHGNGRDWWIVVPYFDGDYYHRFLLDDRGVHDMGMVFTTDMDMRPGVGQAVFSPDGSKYINFSSLSVSEGQFVGVYNFDRCTGNLSNPRLITYNDTAYAAGVAISENGRFAYISSYTHLYQIDLDAEDIAESFHKIADYDGYWEEIEFLQTTFFMAQLTPDGRIFINSPNSARYLHSVEHPNRRGVASDFRQHSVHLPVWNQLTLPNFPYYGLGPLDGSPCDTLNINNPAPVADFEYTQDTTALAVEFFDASFYAYAWVWDFGDGSASSSEHHPVHSYAQDGACEVCLTVSNVTGVDTYCESIYVGVSSTQEYVAEGVEVRVWPNPTASVLHIRLLNLEGLVNVSHVLLRDLQGREVLRQVSSSMGDMSLDVSALPAGLYIYEVYGDRLLASGKVVKR